MAKSETAKKATKAINAIDKLVANLTKDLKKVQGTLEELKETEKKNDEKKKGV